MPDPLEPNDEQNGSQTDPDEVTKKDVTSGSDSMPRFLPLWIDRQDGAQPEADQDVSNAEPGETARAESDSPTDQDKPASSLNEQNDLEAALSKPGTAQDAKTDLVNESPDPEGDQNNAVTESLSQGDPMPKSVAVDSSKATSIADSDSTSDAAAKVQKRNDASSADMHKTVQKNEPAPLKEAAEGERHLQQISASDHILLAKLISKKLSEETDR